MKSLLVDSSSKPYFLVSYVPRKQIIQCLYLPFQYHAPASNVPTDENFSFTLQDSVVWPEESKKIENVIEVVRTHRLDWSSSRPRHVSLSFHHVPFNSINNV